MNTPKWLLESEVALHAISQAAEVYNSAREPVQAAREKETQRDLITAWDLLLDKRLTEALQRHDAPIVSEEQRAADQPIGDQVFRRSWWLDPIDGTVNFALGLPLYGTAVAWMEEGQFMVGAAVLPAMGELYFTYGDQGTFLNGRHVSSGPRMATLATSLVGVTFSSTKVAGRTTAARTHEYEMFGWVNDHARGAVRLGSALVQLCYLTAGRFHAVYGAFAQGWDVGAGLALAAHAGLEVRYRREPGTTRYHFVAGHSQVVNELVSEFKNRAVEGLNRL